LSLSGALAGALIGLGAAVLAGRGRLAGQSPGARDNGSGVIAALAAAAATDDHTVGVVITGAEEFGLVGARALARERPGLFAGRAVLNFDTLDETGRLYLVSHDARGDAAAAGLLPALAGLGVPVRRRRLPVGILVDSLPFARAGAIAVTVARLDWSTLRRIHTARDTGDASSFRTAEQAGSAVVQRPN
jgi:Zn-dependent M28 family amino/carboxypeptidase